MSWRPWRSRCSARTGSRSSAHLDDAIDAAVTLAEEAGDDFAGAGVLVTGSIVTVGEARTLLGGR